jgi:predicted NBD/HSP70 family sugar kinase
LKIASIFVLENILRDHGIDPKPLWFSPDDWIDFGKPLDIWIDDTAAALAQAVIAAASVIDFSAVVIDGGFPSWVRERIVNATKKALGAHDLQGVVVPDIIEGMVGSQARAIGGASLPLFDRYLLDHNVLFKETG